VEHTIQIKIQTLDLHSKVSGFISDIALTGICTSTQ